MIRSNEPSALVNLLENTKTSKPGQMDFRTEYTDNFNKIGSDKFEKPKSFVMKKANAESDIWKMNKDIYDDPKLQKEVIFNTNSMAMDGEDVPQEFKESRFNMKVTTISQYSNALFNNEVFINPRFSSC